MISYCRKKTFCAESEKRVMRMAFIRYPRQWLDELNSRADIVQIVSEHVQLKKNGANYIGLCPFHHEKTASFSVNPTLNVYHCFGCKAGGNLIGFVMNIDHLSFQEAVEYLADRYHMELPEQKEDPLYEQRKQLTERVYAANKEAARFYHSVLWTDHGKPVLNYFYSRGLDDPTIRKFGLGASSGDRKLLFDHLSGLGFSEEDMISAGLIVSKDDQKRDMFFNRALFPIIDLYGRVLGFGGRALEADIKPKYINTADTVVFNKRKGVFAANLLKKQAKLSRIILVEGYLDVISLTQFGIGGVVATLGTALTIEQVRLLKRFAPEIWLAYDGDEAGQHAIERGIALCRQEDMTAKVLFFPDGQDPDEFIRSRGTDAFNALSPMKAVSYQLMRVEKECDMSSDEGRIDYAKKASAVLKVLRDPVELEFYEKKIAAKSGFSFESIRSQVNVKPAAQREEIKYGNSRPARQENSDALRSEKILFALLAMGRLPQEALRPDDLEHPVLVRAAKEILDGKSLDEILNDTDLEADRQLLSETAAILTSDELDDPARTANECMRIMNGEKLKKELEEYKIKLQQENDESTRKYLLGKITELRRLISNPDHR